MYTYIYIYRERERDVYTYTYIYIYRERERKRYCLLCSYHVCDCRQEMVEDMWSDLEEMQNDNNRGGLNKRNISNQHVCIYIYI